MAGDGAIAEVVVVLEGPKLGDECLKRLLVVVELLNFAEVLLNVLISHVLVGRIFM